MNNELVRYATGEVVPRKADRVVARQARAVYDEVRTTALKADGSMALAGHIMEGLLALDAKRQSLSDGDPITNAMLAEIQVNAMRSVKKLQANLFDSWGM